jgi:hypothetical protein
MAKEMRMVTATHRHCCAMPGCMNRTYTYFTRRDNPAGAVWLCGDCVQAMNDIVCPPVDLVPAEVEPETVEVEPEVEPEEPVPADEPAKPARRKGKNA